MTREEVRDSSVDTALMQIENEPFMPALSIRQAVERFNTVVEFVRTVMREGVDYGVIPGTDKPTLLKPGAEKLCTLFGLASRFEIISSVEDWTGEHHNGEAFFFYLYRCRLWRGDMVMAEGDGSCNSWEQKYRYREAQRKCPACGQAAIIRGKQEFGGGWVCFRKRGGCGAKFSEDDPVITDQQAGRILNENIADQVNTIQKMAQKRSLISATLLAVNGSEFFTQDREEFMIRLEAVESKVAPAPKEEHWQCTPAQKQMVLHLSAQIVDRCGNREGLRKRLVSDFGVESPAHLGPAAVARYIAVLKQMLQTAQSLNRESRE